MHYELTDEFVRRLLERGAFNGIEDGREAEHGPVFIQDFELRDPPAPTASPEIIPALHTPFASRAKSGDDVGPTPAWRILGAVGWIVGLLALVIGASFVALVRHRPLPTSAYLLATSVHGSRPPAASDAQNSVAINIQSRMPFGLGVH